MGETSISWTDYTFNIVWGCTEVSPACDFCYAREFALAMHFDLWGPDKPRRTFGEAYWNQPLRWNRTAIRNFGRPALVFCSSMADIFESHPTTQQELLKLQPLIAATPNLDWLLLTKHGWNDIHRHPELISLPNAHVGVTVETQEYGYRIREHVQWLSIEPMLGPIDLENVKAAGAGWKNVLEGRWQDDDFCGDPIQWVIVGGESENDRDPKAKGTARKMELQWALDLKAQCQKYGVAFHFKQTGHRLAEEMGLTNRAGKHAHEWPKELQIQEFPKWRDVPLALT